MRLIARLDVKNDTVIKGIQMEGLRKVGKPGEMALRYYEGGVDELLFMDCVASLYARQNIFQVIRDASKEIFIPITIGGGLRTVTDVEASLDSGADKVAINTEATKRPQFITELAKRFGSQCVVGSIEAKRIRNRWEAYVDSGREPTGLDVVEWARTLADLGAGELLITSVDRDGTRSGFDIELVKAVNSAVSIPVIAGGGMGKRKHIVDLLEACEPSAVSMATILHYGIEGIADIRADANARTGA